MDYEIIRNRLETELYNQVSNEIASGDRQVYEGKIREWEARYHAQRSIKGLMLTGQEDPEIKPLSDPYDGCADYGVPVELALSQELVPNVMTAHMGLRPYTETTRMDERGSQPAGYVDDFITYMLDRAGIRKIRRETVLAAYKYGESLEKLIIEPKTRMVNEVRQYLTRGKGKNREILIGPGGEPVEVTEAMDLKTSIMILVQGEDPRSLIFRYNMRMLKLDPRSAMEAAGLEVGEDWVKVAPVVPPESQDQPPSVDWARAVKYEVNEVEVSEEITINRWPQFVNIHPKDFITPSGAKSNNLMDYWNCHRYPQSLSWLVERIGDGHGDGFYADVVKEIVDKAHEQSKSQAGEKKATAEEIQPEIWEVYDRFIFNTTDDSKDDYMVETEIIAWFCPDNVGHPLLGWQVNPAVRFPCEHIRPLFLFQVKPENTRFHGLSIPETATGTRNMLDWLMNNELNYEAIAKFPPTLMSPAAYKHEQNQHSGLGERWVVEAGETVKLLEYARPTGTSLGLHNTLLLTLRIMWGASEHMSGQKTKTESKTLGEAQLIASKGAAMFQDTVESISQTADKQYEYAKNFYLFSDVSGLQFNVRPNKKNPDVKAISMTKKLLEGPMVIKSRRILTEAEREVKLKGYQIALDFLAKTQSPLFRSVKFMREMMVKFFDAVNMENFEIPTQEELQTEMANIQKQAQEMVVNERYRKALEGEKNKGARKQVEAFLDRNGPGQVNAGLPGGGGQQIPRPGIPTSPGGGPR